ncbi:MAG TPA: HAMP domain-containing sensor histidine kinase [Gemmatimonadaceae bacterium]|nr:HAMP domain-containing sensor histidine kinase [Gemmatimonadaceae bacterium]
MPCYTADNQNGRIVGTAPRRLSDRAASSAKTDLLAMMGHELRTPLNAISGYVQLLSTGVYGPVNPAQVDALARVDRAQRHLQQLVRDLTDLVRVESGYLNLETTEIDVADLAADLESMVGPQARAKNIDLVFGGCGERRVVADRARLMQILLNLLSNAIKFTPEGGSIRLDCPSRDGSVLMESTAFLRVRDTGPGIARDKQATIFEPFVQVEASGGRAAEGVGLGLTISRHLARAMEGDLRVRSELGAGSSFTLSLPSPARRRGTGRRQHRMPGAPDDGAGTGALPHGA